MRSTVAVLAVLALSATSPLGQTTIGTAAVVAAQAPAPPPGAVNPNGPAKPTTPAPAPATAPAKPTPAAGVDLPPGYVVGIQDVLDVSIWKEKDMSSEGVVVRPDGKISLPLVNDVDAVGLTVDQLRKAIADKAAAWVKEPEVSVVVKAINSRRVSVLGQVAKPGQYPLLARMDVVELLSMAGGTAEYADKKKIRIARKTKGQTQSFLFNLKDYQDGKPKGLEQNIELMPGDVVTVP